jgi:alkanesulfonate monooxygenase SsuD/methylene tetrahydromethanopterin reductase-like flavin-dependent oxidoreductase (luciferase family)
MKFGIFSEVQIPKPLHNDDWDPGQEARAFNEVLDQVEFADRLGYDYLFQVEHHFSHEYSHSSAPEIILATLARRTQRIRLGTGITQMPPPVNHPARVAERVATLDILSGGRVEFGTGAGASDAEVEPFGVPEGAKHGMWREATEECLKMMSQALYPGIQGEYFSMPAREVVPKPIQKPHPPVWMAAGRGHSVAEAAELGMGSLSHTFESPDTAATRVTSYWEQLRRSIRPIGQAINPATTSVANMLCCPTTEEAIAKGQPGADFFTFAISRTRRKPIDHLHRDFAAGERDEPVGPLSETERRFMQLSSGPFMMLGSPAHLRDLLRQYEAARVDIFIFLIQCGVRPHEQIMASLELFAKDVMPEFQDRHSAHQRWREEQLDGISLPVVCSV